MWYFLLSITSKIFLPLHVETNKSLVLSSFPWSLWLRHECSDELKSRLDTEVVHTEGGIRKWFCLGSCVETNFKKIILFPPEDTCLFLDFGLFFTDLVQTAKKLNIAAEMGKEKQQSCWRTTPPACGSF